jgi:hypothetical protein
LCCPLSGRIRRRCLLQLKKLKKKKKESSMSLHQQQAAQQRLAEREAARRYVESLDVTPAIDAALNALLRVRPDDAMGFLVRCSRC